MPGDAELPSGGAEADPFATAVMVVAVDVQVDPVTLDRLFIVHSETTAPIRLRVPALAMTAILHTLASAVSRAMN